jgi:orotate phosphoribosyltransferase
MGGPTTDEDLHPTFYQLVGMRRGHFRLESGHHSAMWLDLDGLFAEPRKIEPLVAELTEEVRDFDVEVVCGPLVGGAFLAQLVARMLEVEFCYTEREALSGVEEMFRARYRLPAAFAARLDGKRCAMVDDVMSAGSALRGTYASLRANGADPAIAGALLVLGSTGASYFAREGVPVVSVLQEEYSLWDPASCPLCRGGMPLEDQAPPTA